MRFLDLKIYENPTHIGRVSAWSKTGAAIFILKIDVRKKIEQPPITNSIDSKTLKFKITLVSPEEEELEYPP